MGDNSSLLNAFHWWLKVSTISCNLIG